MDTLLPYGIKGFISLGSMVLAAGFLSSVRLQSSQVDLGVLSDTISPHLQHLYDVVQYYPAVQPVYEHMTAQVLKFAEAFHSSQTPSAMLRLQRRIFDDLDDITMELSESTALEDIYTVTDNLKQVITDICLSIDR